MKTTTTTLMSVALALGLASSAIAKSEKKNDPNKREVGEALKEAGEKHNPPKIKLAKVGSIKADGTYYHIWCGTQKKDYRILVFNNTPSYLGFYTSEFEPVDYEEGAVLLDSGESDGAGNIDYYRLPIGLTGPADKIRVGGVTTSFIKNDGAELAKSSAKATVADSATAEEEENPITYRDWKIKMQGKVRTYNAVFVKKEGSKVYIKDSKRGKTAAVPYSSLSTEDQKYIKNLPK